MRKFAWIVFAVLAAMPIFGQKMPKDPAFQKLIQMSQPDSGGVWKPLGVQVLNGTMAALSTPAPQIPPTIPQEFAKLGPSVWSHDDTYTVPVSRPLDLDLDIYVDGMQVASQHGAGATGVYHPGEEELTGSFEISNPGRHEVQIIGTTSSGVQLVQQGTYELPVHPRPQVSPLTFESGDYFTILPKVTLSGAPLESVNVRESFVLFGNYSQVQENWNPDSDDSKQGIDEYSGRRIAHKVRVYMRDGELHADYPSRPGRNGYLVYKFFVRYPGGWATHPAVLAHTKPYTPEPKLGIQDDFDVQVRNEWSTIITSTINAKKALGGWYYWEVKGRRKDRKCEFGPNEWSASGWGYVPPGQETYVIAMNVYLPKDFEFAVYMNASLETSPNVWEYFSRKQRVPATNQEIGCWYPYPPEKG